MFRFSAIPKYERAMDVLAERQRVIGQNVANTSTPGYKTKDVDFSGELTEAMGFGDDSPYADMSPQAMAMEHSAYDTMEHQILDRAGRKDAATDEALKEVDILKKEMYQEDGADEGLEPFEVYADAPNGVNDVQMESEMSKMTETGILYRAYTELARKRFKQIDSAIKESV